MKYKKMPLQLNVYIAQLHQDKGTRICELERRFSEYPKTTIYGAAKKKFDRTVQEKRHKNKGRPRKLILEDSDIIDQSVALLQTNKEFLHQRMCYRSLMFQNHKFHVEL